MKNLLHRGFKIAGLALLLAGGRAAAQDFEISVTQPPASVAVGETVNYTISITNRSGLELFNVIVVSSVPSTAQFISATNIYGSATNLFGNTFFQIQQFPTDTFVTMTLNVSPTQVGAFTNTVGVAAANVDPATNSVGTVVFEARADVGVTIAGPTAQILTGDVLSYTMTVSNAGPNSVSSLVLSNQLPPGVGVVSTTPSPATSTNGYLNFNVGLLLSGGSRVFLVQAQPTNAGVLNFSAALLGSAILDANSTNNTASTNITVSAPLSAELTVSLVTTQQFNPQTGLMEQIVRLTNGGTNSIDSARVLVGGLTNWLYNASGTNSGQPFVIYTGNLAAGASVDLVLKFFIPSKKPAAGLTFTAVQISPFFPPVPAGTAVAVSRVVMLSSGRLLIEFPSIPGRAYTILYSPDSAFTTNFVVQPDIIAPANRTQWIDEGPPATSTAPMNTSSRYYRVLQH